MSVRARAAMAAALLLIVLLIGWAQGEGLWNRADATLMQRLAGFRGSWLDSAMRTATWLGNTETRIGLGALFVMVLLAFSRWRAAILLIGAAVGGTLLNQTLKQLFARARPELIEHLVQVHSYSFPSGHSAGSAALWGGLALAIGGRGAIAGAIAITALVGISRTYLGVHWPSDVVAGWTTGVAWLFAWHAAGERLGLLAPRRLVTSR